MDTNITTNMDTTICISNLCRQVEDEDGEVEDADAGDDQVHNVEKGLSTDLQVEENIWRSSGYFLVNSRYLFCKHYLWRFIVTSSFVTSKTF